MATQRRFSIGFFTTFHEALEAKMKALVENPDNTYQIRKSMTGGKKNNPSSPKETFSLVQRVTANEAAQIINTAEKLRKGKKRRVKNYQGPVRPNDSEA